MKTKKLNRGLILGAAMLVGLGGYVVFDYVSFKSNKSDIEAEVRQYLNDTAAASVSSDGECAEAWKKVIDEHWGYNRFFDDSFMYDYLTAAEIRSDIDDYAADDRKRGYLSECSVNVSEIKVSKAGPNLAKAEVTYDVMIRGKGNADILGTNGIWSVLAGSNNMMESALSAEDTERLFSELEYSGSIQYDGYSAQYYLELDGGKWKIVGIDGYDGDISLFDEGGEELNFDVLAAAAEGKAPAEGTDGQEGGSGEAEAADEGSVPGGDKTPEAEAAEDSGNGGEGDV